MTQEQKAKAYDEVREKIALRFGSNVAEEIFSEFEMSEDEKVRKWLYGYFRSLFATWIHPDITCEEILAWLKKQGEKPADWSVEDTFKVQRICEYLDEAKKYYADITEVRDCVDWLKSLRPQSKWKPSEEQMKALDSVIDEYDGYPEFDSLVSLKNDLKKL